MITFVASVDRKRRIFYEGGAPELQKQDFKKSLSVLKDTKIILFLSDNQFVEGILLDVKQDYLVVNVNQNIFYIALKHIQGLSKNAKGFRMSPQVMPYLNKDNLTDLLKALQYNLISVNSLGKQAFFGMLSKISDDHITLIDNMEQLYIQKSYISNIYKGKYEISESSSNTNAETQEQLESSSHTNTETQEQLESSSHTKIQNIFRQEQLESSSHTNTETQDQLESSSHTNTETQEQLESSHTIRKHKIS